MSQHIYPLKWKYLNSNRSSSFSDVFEQKSFADVTLVSDDHIPFQTHRYILSAFSPVFKDILLNNPHSHPLIFLRGVNHKELNSILQFIYLGKASVYHRNMKRFAQVAKDLQIKQLASIIMGPEPEDDLDNNVSISNKDIHEEQTENKYAGRSYSSIADDINNLDIPGSEELWSGMQLLYTCKECESSYNTKKGLNLHTNNKHEGIVHFCHNCGYKTTNKSHLKKHKESVHEGVKYQCNQCGYQATEKGSLKRHKLSVHESIKYQCNQCDYQATDKGHLRRHKVSVHEGVM